ncbi:MAG: hypothetical protein M1115_01800 [Actinobacteria bacterium]|nr:hypothetical protein [Actinomycetota bacterium]
MAALTLAASAELKWKWLEPPALAPELEDPLPVGGAEPAADPETDAGRLYLGKLTPCTERQAVYLVSSAFAAGLRFFALKPP